MSVKKTTRARGFADWSSLGATLKSVEGSIMWWIGDWLRYGEHKWGCTYQQAAEQTGYDQGILRTAKWVAEAFPDLSCRQDKLNRSGRRLADGHRAEAGAGRARRLTPRAGPAPRPTAPRRTPTCT